MVTLYKDGEASPPLYPVDARSWLKVGWSEVNPDAVVTEDAPPTDKPENIQPVQTTKEYLNEIFSSKGWIAIKEIATDLNIEKPEGSSWEDTIPLIVLTGWTPED